MPRFKVAHIREQGVDLIIIPLDSAYGHRTSSDQNDVIAELQRHATSAGLAGQVVPVWDSGGGRMSFIAPRNWHRFFASLNLSLVQSNLNKEIYW
ncbi:hypothetical protein [Pandoraea communis]|uniref:hypothetical protein n=1 Tax=Pandoraea communis TaxID=2508297 RepID=UPI0025A57B19|nr:hypothetical protein [Pandoraea communis]MDM8356380.1 hypothetical protein [Pandoraea communis]